MLGFGFVLKLGLGSGSGCRLGLGLGLARPERWVGNMVAWGLGLEFQVLLVSKCDGSMCHDIQAAAVECEGCVEKLCK
eukprot:1326896-Amorphochlora_amoeboformis.AAC.1